MSTRRSLAQRLGVVAGFDDPRVDLEQYPTPPELAAYLVHVADLQGDLADRTVVDLGAGTGMLALAAALRGAGLVVGVELDRDPLETAVQNERKVATTTDIDWVQGDATRSPLATDRSRTTVLMNPPFGAQHGNRGADKAFLETARSIASVSYSVHNEGSQEFVEAFAADVGGEVTHAYEAEFELDNQFVFHEDEQRILDAEVFRIEWE
ncbi:RNA methylase [Salinarchaeum sp. Harcht-Bsk1]|uniref:METTL5 family protein n=1 Tax=Salinarchaeum sp. Harcht-Bsk1 TaxID=1333523 RepID=UPI00034239A5|nr:METTL5 family protein [Salinarchaeum sp. Harcht-Bsk1]AGN02906.1 RNA methylase [Salinarchaeum sp. Harcht-Bsk1]